MWAKQSLWWMHCLENHGLKIGNSPTTSTHYHFVKYNRRSWQNTDDLQRCSPKCQASLHQIQSLLRHKSQRFKTRRSILYICLTVESRSSREKNSFFGIQGIGPYIIEKVLPNNKHLVRKIGIHNTQGLHRMQMRHFTERQPPPDIGITPQQWKLNRKWASKTRTCMLEHWSVTTKGQFSTPKAIMQRHPIQQKLQYNRIYQPRKRGIHQEPHESVPEKFLPKQRNYVT